MSEKFVKFCKQFGIEQITFPVRDHRGNGKIERLIRTINERLRANLKGGPARVIRNFVRVTNKQEEGRQITV